MIRQDCWGFRKVRPTKVESKRSVSWMKQCPVQKGFVAKMSNDSSLKFFKFKRTYGLISRSGIVTAQIVHPVHWKTLESDRHFFNTVQCLVWTISCYFSFPLFELFLRIGIIFSLEKTRSQIKVTIMRVPQGRGFFCTPSPKLRSPKFQNSDQIFVKTQFNLPKTQILRHLGGSLKNHTTARAKKGQIS